MQDDESEFEPPTRIDPGALSPAFEMDAEDPTALEPNPLHPPGSAPAPTRPLVATLADIAPPALDPAPDLTSHDTQLPLESTEHEVGLPERTRADLASPRRADDTAHNTLQSPRDQTAHDQTAHDQTAHDQTAHDGGPDTDQERGAGVGEEPPTVVHVSPSHVATVVRPLPATLPPETRSVAERPTEPPPGLPMAEVAPERATTPASPEPSPAPPAARATTPKATPTPSEAETGSLRRTLLIAAAAGLIGGGALVAALTTGDPPTETGERPEVATPDTPPDPSGPVEGEALPATAVSLPEAADLAIRGRFAEAARAYRGLAASHPDRPELAVMAEVLAQKADAP